MFFWNVQKSFFFQMGVLTALVMASILCGCAVRDGMALMMGNRKLAFEVSLMEKQIEAQKDRYQFLSETSAAVRRQRHDLKHHMVVIHRWAISGEREKLIAYLDQVLKDIPSDTGRVQARDLCMIIGNLLENGIESCFRAKNPFLTMKSRLINGILTITMDNRVSFVSRTREGGFSSLKPGGGMGLLSIESVAEKYGAAASLTRRTECFILRFICIFFLMRRRKEP